MAGMTAEDARRELAFRDDGESDEADLVLVRKAIKVGLQELMGLATMSEDDEVRARSSVALLSYGQREKIRLERKKEKKPADPTGGDPRQRCLFGDWELKRPE